MTGDESALSLAIRAARWSIGNRLARSGAFGHAAADRGGPFLDDSLAMSQAFVALYRSTGAREWLSSAKAALAAINQQLRDAKAGFVAAPAALDKHGVFRNPIRQPEQNAALARLASLMHHYTSLGLSAGRLVGPRRGAASQSRNPISAIGSGRCICLHRKRLLHARIQFGRN